MSGPEGPDDASQSVSRILSRTAIHLGAPLPTRSRGLPGTSAGHRSSLLGLAPGGVCLAVTIARDAGGLLLHRFTLACATWSSDQAPSAVCSLLHFPSGHPAWKLSSTLPCGVRTFLNQWLQPLAATVQQTRTDESTTWSAFFCLRANRRHPKRVSKALPARQRWELGQGCPQDGQRPLSGRQSADR